MRFQMDKIRIPTKHKGKIQYKVKGSTQLEYPRIWVCGMKVKQTNERIGGGPTGEYNCGPTNPQRKARLSKQTGKITSLHPNV